MPMDLETPTPPPAEPTPPAQPAAPPPPAAPPAPPPDPDESQAVDVGGEKMVPLAAVKAVRAENKVLKDKAAKADELAGYVNQVKPYIDVLQANPSLMQGPQPKPAAPVDADPDLVEIAQSLDYYQQDGKPDLARAAKHQKILQREAHKIAQQMVQPVARQTATQQSQANFVRFANQALPNGQKVDQQLLAKYWQSLPAEMTADPRVGMVAYNLAYAEQMQNNGLPPQPPPPVNPPLVTENIGPAPRSKPMTAIEKMVTAARGISDSKYQELTTGFTPGRPSSLED
jgi:hypothetical protein